jgi:uncharacterized SAM-binding protein YcdF (DUF218 family)
MFYILSKMLLFFINPMNWILLGLILSCTYYRTSKGKKYLIFTILLLFTLGNEHLANYCLTNWEYPPTELKKVEKYQTAVLLGGVTKSEQTPKDRVHFGTGADRVLHTALLWKTGKIQKIVVSGGLGQTPKDTTHTLREAEAMAVILKQCGVPNTAILIEKKSRNTRENALFTAQLINPQQTPEILLITSAFHMKRAIACYEKVGFSVVPFATDFRADGNYKWYNPNGWLPSVHAFGKWELLLKEWVGLATYKVMGYA